MSDLVIFLQNSWSPYYAGSTWPRKSWLRALAASKSGKKLRLITSNLDVCDNLTPIVGDRASSIVPPDTAYIVKVLARRKPSVVVGCGLVAEKVLPEIWDKHLLILPHPACRWLPDQLYRQGKEMIDLMVKHAGDQSPIRVKIWQLKGQGITTSQLPPVTAQSSVCKVDEGNY